MNDKIIIKTISILYTIAVTIFLFILFFLFSLFITLQNGIYIDKFSAKNVKIEELYIKWNEKIDVSIANIKISNTNNSNSKIDINNLVKKISKYSTLINLFGFINLENIYYNDIYSTFKYSENSGGIFEALSKKFVLKSSVHVEMNKVLVSINSFKDLNRDIFINGNILLNYSTILASLNINIKQNINLNINAVSTQTQLFYKLSSKKEITTITEVVNMLSLPKEIRYWVLDAIKMSSLKLDKAHGWMDYNNLEDAYKNIYVSAVIDKLHYTYDIKLDAVHTGYTELEFKNGILYIKPKEAYSYNQYLGNSWVKIDFTQKEELLTLFLLFDGVLNKDILKILNRYKINLPFLQKSGQVTTDLKIKVNLRTIKIDAQGDFYTKKANFDYLGLNIDIFNAHIFLNNYDVKIDNMLAHYKDIVVSKVDVSFNAKTSTGKINFKANSIKFNDIGLSSVDQTLHITYNIIPNNDFIDIEKSQWKFQNELLTIEKLTIPFDIDTLIVKIPTTLVKIKDKVSLYLSGETTLPSLNTVLDIDLVSLNYKNIYLSQKKANIKFIYNGGFNLILDKNIHLVKNSLKYSLNKSYITLNNSLLSIKTNIDIDNMISTHINLDYNLKNTKGKISATNTRIQTQSLGNLLNLEDEINFNINNSNNLLTIQSDDINSKFQYKNEIWILNIESLDKLASNSKLLQKFNISNGKIILNKNNQSDFINFNASIKYPHKVLVIDNKPVQEYKINGNINTVSLVSKFNLNNKIDIIMGNDINITAKNIGINVLEVIDSLENNSSEKNNNNININFNALNSYLYISKDRHIISDTISLSYKNNEITSHLNYNNGAANFKLKDNRFNLVGTNFNDTFMSKLFALSKFKGGKLDFSMQGKIKDYIGTFNINKTTIIDYKLLNNILAFVNTIPSLVTFRLPGYSEKGLKVKNSYINFRSKDDLFTISDIYLDSKEIDITGRGDASFVKNSIDLTLNLKTDLASALAQIPVVGYILFDKDSISTSLKISGKLDNPTISSLLAREIIVAPLNILKRTILTPIHLLTGDGGKLIGENK